MVTIDRWSLYASGLSDMQVFTVLTLSTVDELFHYFMHSPNFFVLSPNKMVGSDIFVRTMPLIHTLYRFTDSYNN